MRDAREDSDPRSIRDHDPARLFHGYGEEMRFSNRQLGADRNGHPAHVLRNVEDASVDRGRLGSCLVEDPELILPLRGIVRLEPDKAHETGLRPSAPHDVAAGAHRTRVFGDLPRDLDGIRVLRQEGFAGERHLDRRVGPIPHEEDPENACGQGHPKRPAALHGTRPGRRRFECGNRIGGRLGKRGQHGLADLLRQGFLPVPTAAGRLRPLRVFREPQKLEFGAGREELPVVPLDVGELAEERLHRRAHLFGEDSGGRLDQEAVELLEAFLGTHRRSPSRLRRTRSSPRRRCDFTVPSGSPVRSAISE